MKLAILTIIWCFLDHTVGDQLSTDYCEQLSQTSLVHILGQAFNPRYMSIYPPVIDMSSTGNKRASYEIPFYVDEDMVSVGDFPAWETNHLSYFEKKEDREVKERKEERIRRSIAERLKARTGLSKSRPWECKSQINWIDLGVNYFPRYIRSVECIAKKCWYGHFNCRPKSFTIKVLRKKSGSCIRISKKLATVTETTFDKEYTELWVWEELSINFCCECVSNLV